MQSEQLARQLLHRVLVRLSACETFPQLHLRFHKSAGLRVRLRRQARHVRLPEVSDNLQAGLLSL